MAPATTLPEQAPMLWIITFSPRAPRRRATVLTPTAMMAMGIAASNTCPTFSPRYAAAAEKRTAITIPHATLHAVTSGYSLSARISGSYTSPSFNTRKALSGSPICSCSFSMTIIQLSNLHSKTSPPSVYALNPLHLCAIGKSLERRWRYFLFPQRRRLPARQSLVKYRGQRDGAIPVLLVG